MKNMNQLPLLSSPEVVDINIIWGVGAVWTLPSCRVDVCTRNKENKGNDPVRGNIPVREGGRQCLETC